MMTLSPAPRASASLPDAEAARSPEADLVRAAAGGSDRAFEELVRSHQHRVFNYLLHLVRHRQDAEDLTQQTFVKAYHHLERFDCSRPLINWLLTIARHNGLNHFRASRRWEEIPEQMPCTTPSPARQVEHQDHADTVWARARRVLSEKEFNVLWLRTAEELSIEETARVTGLTQIHVKVLLHRARNRLLKGEARP